MVPRLEVPPSCWRIIVAVPRSARVHQLLLAVLAVQVHDLLTWGTGNASPGEGAGRTVQTRPCRLSRLPAPHRRLGIRHLLFAAVAPAGGASGTTRCRRPGWPGHVFAASAAFYRGSASGLRPRTAPPADRARVSTGPPPGSAQCLGTRWDRGRRVPPNTRRTASTWL
jgi:hypothetical protein